MPPTTTVESDISEYLKYEMMKETRLNPPGAQPHIGSRMRADRGDEAAVGTLFVAHQL